MILRFELLRWSAWAPGLSSLEQWQTWACSNDALPEGPEKPPVQFLPAQLRRRCSTVSRAALLTTFSVLTADEQNGTPSIFASQHGESQTTIELLQTLAADELLSPTSFGLSVHNTVSGLFSIAATNRCNSTALAAGEHFIPAALIESSSILQASGVGKRVVCTLADEPLFHALRTPAGRYPLVSCSLLLGTSDETGAPNRCILELSSCEDGSPQAPLCYSEFLRWLLLLPTTPLQTQMHGTPWMLQLRGSDAPSSLFRTPHGNAR